MIELVGRGKGLVSNRKRKFLVTKWLPDGDLESTRKGTCLHNSFVFRHGPPNAPKANKQVPKLPTYREEIDD